MSNPSSSPIQFEHVAYRASAGTGKTYQLSNRYIGLLMAGESPSQILATTFTRKAAGEIAERVLERLAKAATDSGEAAALADAIARPELRQKDFAEVLAGLCLQLHQLRISTLDSTFIQFAKVFELESGLPPGWSILDSVDEETLRKESLRSMLQSLLEDPAQLVEMIRLLNRGANGRSVTSQLEDLVYQLQQIYVETEGREEIWQWFPSCQSVDQGQLMQLCERLASLELPKKKSGEPMAAWITVRDQLSASVMDEDWEAVLNNGLVKKVLLGESSYSRGKIEEDWVVVVQEIVAQGGAVLIHQLAEQTRATFKFLSAYEGHFRYAQSQWRALRFHDVTDYLARMKKMGFLEDLYFRLDGRISHLLLDEFQDTSLAQWSVLRPIAQEIVVDSDERRSFFCVGDMKQAIYGWRGGEAELIRALESQLDRLETKSLSKSYRSAPVIMQTVNQLFKKPDGLPALEGCEDYLAPWNEIFEAHSSAEHLRETGGEVRLWAAPLADKERNEKQNTVTLQATAELVKKLSRRHPRRSIAVLVRKNKEVARLIYELGQGVDAVEASEEGGNPLTHHPVVTVLMSLLRLMDHPADSVAAYHVATSPWGKVMRLLDWEDTAAFMEWGRKARQQWVDLGAGTLIESWISGVASFCDESGLEALWRVMGIVRELQEGSRELTPSRLEAVLAERKVDDPRSARIRVMTVHQSKGLEFDIVVLPMSRTGNWKGMPPAMLSYREDPIGMPQRVTRYPGGMTQELLPELQEMMKAHHAKRFWDAMCVLYVAVTRAARAIHFVLDPSKPSGKDMAQNTWGLVRGALHGDERLEPGSLVLEHEAGRADWDEWMQQDVKLSLFPDVGEHAGHDLGEAHLSEIASDNEVSLRFARDQDAMPKGLARLSPSSLEGGHVVNLQQKYKLSRESSFEKGTVIHGWFELVDWKEDGAVDPVAMMEISESLGVPLEEAEQWRQVFEQVLASGRIGTALSQSTYEHWEAEGLTLTVRNEFNFVVSLKGSPYQQSGGNILNGAIDRLVLGIKEGRVIRAEILDFKTDYLQFDQYREQAISDRVKHYQPQVQAYAFAVSRMFGITISQISARLLFVDVDEVRYVDL